MVTLGTFIQEKTLRHSPRDEAGTFIVNENPKIKIQYFFTLEPRKFTEKYRLEYLEKYKNKKNGKEEQGPQEHEANISKD